MKTSLTIKNFRVFDENGATIELNPITILTGCNSSGKSSIVKALLLLDSFLQQIKRDYENGNPINLKDYKLDFGSYPNNLLGRFDRVIHSGSATQKVTIEYTVYSLLLSKEVNVRLVFSADNYDELNNAYLDSVSMSTDAGLLFSSTKSNGIFSEGNYRNCNLIKDQFLDFLKIDYICNYYFGLCSSYEIDGKVSKEEFVKERDEVFNELRKFDRSRLKDVVCYIYTGRERSFLGKNKVDYYITEWTREHGSFFMIPIIEQLDKLSKGQIMQFINDNVLTNDKSSISDLDLIASQKIIHDFIQSEAESFGQYFKEYENRFFDGKDCKSANGRSSYVDCPCLETSLNISQEYLAFDPRDEVISGFVSFDDDNNEVPEKENEQNPEQRFELWKNTPIDFDMIYEIVMLWNTLAGNDTPENYKYYTRINAGMFQVNTEYNHKMLLLLKSFFTELLRELMLPEWSNKMNYVSSSRVSVKRLYSLEDSYDFTQLLRSFFEGQRTYLETNNFSGISDQREYKVGSFMNRWIRVFEIGDAITVNIDKEGLGVQLRLHKTENDDGNLLADEGYGITQLVSILLQIETAIITAKKKKVNYYMGMGSFKKLIDHIDKYEFSTIAIEEPEIHLHPRFQSMLADMIVEAYKKYNVHFIVETHSEYLIRKLQVLVAGNSDELNKQINKEDVSILYIYSPKDVAEKGAPQVKRIGIGEDGRLDSPFGPGFFDEADNLAMDLLRLKAQ